MPTIRWTWSLSSVAALALVLNAGSCSGGSNGGTATTDAGPDASMAACSTNADCEPKLPPTTPPGCATATCNALQGVCVFVAKDQDGDGHPAASCKSSSGPAVQAGDDCNDQDANLFPGHPEPCTPGADAGSPPAGFCAGQVSCLADGTESACTSTHPCSTGEACVGGTTCMSGCDIGGSFYQPSAPNPSNPCQSCAPASSTATWTNAADGTSCGNGQVCAGGMCGTQCVIGGTPYASGAVHPSNSCESCQPATSTTGWTPVSTGPACSSGVCSVGQCIADCYIGGMLFASGAQDPNNACRSCQPATSTTAWSPIKDGIQCTGGTCCAGACVNESTSPSNCGACGNACNAGPSPRCALGVCSYTLASGLMAPAAIAVDSTGVFWTSYGSGSGPDGAVMEVSPSGGAVTTLASGQYKPLGVAIDSASVYWTELGNASATPPVLGTVRKVARSGGAATTLAAAQLGPLGIALDNATVYWVDEGGYNAGNGTVLKAPLAGGGATTLASGQNNAAFLAIQGASVYWSDYSSSGNIMTVGISGGALTTLASGQRYPYAIAVDSTNVYWTSYPFGGSLYADVMQVALSGGSPATLASAQDGPVAIAVDSTAVYWADDASGKVMKAPLSGGTPTTLATGQDRPTGIALYGTNVYWTNFGTNPNTGSVMTATK